MICEEDHVVTIFLNMKGHITINFLEKCLTDTSASGCQLLRQVKKDVKNKQNLFQFSEVIFYQDNARLHNVARSIEVISWFRNNCYTLLTVQMWAPSDLYLFGYLKIFLRGTKFSSDKKVESIMSKSLKTYFKDF